MNKQEFLDQDRLTRGEIRTMEEWWRLAKSKNFTLRMHVAERKDAPVEIIEYLLEDEFFPVAETAMANPVLPSEAIERKLKSELYISFNMQNSIAKNPNTPPRILEKLSKPIGETIRSSVARNPSTPAETLENLSNIDNYVVLSALVENPNLPDEILLKLSFSRFAVIREMATGRIMKRFDPEWKVDESVIGNLFVE